ncbi:MAG: sugar phosphate isomerase/epimerase [Opitutaceae bacterium]|nr:sugar phosphate isomerase/epimerase [Opitutaceae bacterium]
MPSPVMPTLALSTSWNAFRHTDGHAMLREIADLGFSHAELSHGTRVSLVPGIDRAIRDGVIRISSIHAFCPLPPGINRSAPNLFEPSAKDPAERKLWLRYAEQTLEYAAKLGATVAVFHLGSCSRRWFDPGFRLERQAEKRDRSSLEEDQRFCKIREKALEKLRRNAEEPWKRVLESISQVAPRAASLGVRMGLENREGVSELPLEDHWNSLWTEKKVSEICGYWHDTGHARIKKQLGLLDEDERLTALAPNWIGCHLHDTDIAGQDHLPLGDGTIDFEALSHRWTTGHLLTLEFGPRVTQEAVVRSHQRLRALVSARNLG